MIEKAIRSILVADATVTALVGTRIYKDLMPQHPTLPLLVLKKIDKRTGLTLGRDAAGMNRIRMQVDCWAADTDGVAGADIVRTLAEAVNGADNQGPRGPLHGYHGQSEGVRIKDLVLLVERATEFEPDTKLHRVSADYEVTL